MNLLPKEEKSKNGKYFIYLIIFIIVIPVVAFGTVRIMTQKDYGLTKKPADFVELITPNFRIFYPGNWDRSIIDLNSYLFTPKDEGKNAHVSITNNRTIENNNLIKQGDCSFLKAQIGDSEYKSLEVKNIDLYKKKACYMKLKSGVENFTSWTILIVDTKDRILYIEASYFGENYSVDEEKKIENILKSVKVN